MSVACQSQRWLRGQESFDILFGGLGASSNDRRCAVAQSYSPATFNTSFNMLVAARYGTNVETRWSEPS